MKKPFPPAFFLTLLLAGMPLLGSAGTADPAGTSGVVSKLPPEYILDKITGTVMVLPKGAAAPEAAQEEQTVQAGDEVITRKDSEVSMTLPNGTLVQLSADSDVVVGELAYPSRASFTSRLRLSAGRILSQVVKLGQSRSVFEIEAGGVICGVRGTAFEVQTDKTLVTTDTFEGMVEMRKESLTQSVPADRHSEFAVDKGQFLLQRALSEREKALYQNWLHYRELILRREAERQAALKAFDALPQPDQDKLWNGLQKVRERDRFLILRRMMKEQNLQDRLKVIDRAAQARVSAVNERQENERKAQEQRELNLKNRKNIKMGE